MSLVGMMQVVRKKEVRAEVEAVDTPENKAEPPDERIPPVRGPLNENPTLDEMDKGRVQGLQARFDSCSAISSYRTPASRPSATSG